MTNSKIISVVLIDKLLELKMYWVALFVAFD